MAEVHWALDARVDLRLIQAYIARDSPETARQFVDRLQHAAERLRDFPRLGRVVPGARDDRTRELIVHNYRIIYQLMRRGPTVVAVAHAKQDLQRLAEERGWRL